MRREKNTTTSDIARTFDSTATRIIQPKSERTTGTLPAALELARRGYRVLPVAGFTSSGCGCGKDCDAPCKHPLVSKWQKIATSDPLIIRGWWAKWPNANIGFLTGPETMIVLDFDLKSGGLVSLTLLEKELGPLPDGPRVQTGGGGRHYYFAATAA